MGGNLMELRHILIPYGNKYVGEFKDGGKHGQGTMTTSDGRKYVGEFKDGLPNGQGTITWPDGGKEAFPPSKSAYNHLCPTTSCE